MVILTLSEWARLVDLIEDEFGWSEAEVMEAIKDGGWIEQQSTEAAEVDLYLEERRLAHP